MAQPDEPPENLPASPRKMSRVAGPLVCQVTMIGGVLILLVALVIGMEAGHCTSMPDKPGKPAVALAVHRKPSGSSRSRSSGWTCRCDARTPEGGNIEVRITEQEYDEITSLLKDPGHAPIKYYSHLVIPGYMTSAYCVQNLDGMHIVAVALSIFGTGMVLYSGWHTFRRRKLKQLEDAGANPVS